MMSFVKIDMVVFGEKIFFDCAGNALKGEDSI